MKTWKTFIACISWYWYFAFTASGNAKKSDSGSKGKEAFRTLDQIKRAVRSTLVSFSDKNPFGYMDEKTVSIRI